MQNHRLEISSLLEQKQELVQEIEKYKQTASRICNKSKVAKLNTIANNTKQHLNQISKRFSELTEEMSQTDSEMYTKMYQEMTRQLPGIVTFEHTSEYS